MGNYLSSTISTLALFARSTPSRERQLSEFRSLFLSSYFFGSFSLSRYFAALPFSPGVSKYISYIGTCELSFSHLYKSSELYEARTDGMSRFSPIFQPSCRHSTFPPLRFIRSFTPTAICMKNRNWNVRLILNAVLGFRTEHWIFSSNVDILLNTVN